MMHRDALWCALMRLTHRLFDTVFGSLYRSEWFLVAFVNQAADLVLRRCSKNRKKMGWLDSMTSISSMKIGPRWPSCGNKQSWVLRKGRSSWMKYLGRNKNILDQVVKQARPHKSTGLELMFLKTSKSLNIPPICIYLHLFFSAGCRWRMLSWSLLVSKKTGLRLFRVPSSVEGLAAQEAKTFAKSLLASKKPPKNFQTIEKPVWLASTYSFCVTCFSLSDVWEVLESEQNTTTYKSPGKKKSTST